MGDLAFSADKMKDEDEFACKGAWTLNALNIFILFWVYSVVIVHEHLDDGKINKYINNCFLDY